MLLCFVKAFYELDTRRVLLSAEGRTRQGRAAPSGRAGSYQVTRSAAGEGGPGRPADRSKASPGGGSRLAGQAAPGAGASAAVAQVVVDLAGDVTLQAFSGSRG